MKNFFIFFSLIKYTSGKRWGWEGGWEGDERG